MHCLVFNLMTQYETQIANELVVCSLSGKISRLLEKGKGLQVSDI